MLQRMRPLLEQPWCFTHTADVAADANGNVHGVAPGNHHVQNIHQDGVFMESWWSIGSGDGEMGGVQGVGVDGNGPGGDVDGPAAIGHFQYAVRMWARDAEELCSNSLWTAANQRETKMNHPDRPGAPSGDSVHKDLRKMV